MGRRRDGAPGGTPHRPHRRGRQARCAGGSRARAVRRPFSWLGRACGPSRPGQDESFPHCGRDDAPSGYYAFCPNNDEGRENHEAAAQKMLPAPALAFCWPPAAAHPLPVGRNTWDSPSGPGGFYSLLTYRDGTGSLLCYDCETMECTYLAGETDPPGREQPRLPPLGGGDAWLLAGSRHLYVLKPPVPAQLLDDEYKSPVAGLADADGAGRHGAQDPCPCRRAPALSISPPPFWRGEKLLLVLCQQEENGRRRGIWRRRTFDAGTLRHRLDLRRGDHGAPLRRLRPGGPSWACGKRGRTSGSALYDLEKNALEPLSFGGEDVPWCLDGRGGVVYYPEGGQSLPL